MAISAALDARLDAYAQLVIRAGCNLQEGQELFLSCDIACADFARK
ncbi:MAG: aminopeptidase, partial [Coriobacteriales bacterium]|nr:aminopeptidase [Coriobacteriales bacterium]